MLTTKTNTIHSENALRSITIMILVGFVGILFFAGQSTRVGQYFGVVGVGAMVAGAALLAGGLLGFLFGIPRTLQQERSGESASIKQEEGPNDKPGISYQINTNLEQISDWLTKILVGVGLTQLSSLPGFLRSYSDFISAGLGSFTSSSLFGIAELAYFLVCGFLIGYLWTRLYLAGAFRLADLSAVGALQNDVAEMNNKVKEIEEQVNIDARALSLAQRQLNPISGVKPINPDELVGVIKQASEPVKIQIFYLAQAVRSENWQDPETKPKMELTIPLFRALIASDEQDNFHANHGQLGFALKDKFEPDWQGAENELTMAIDIRDKKKKKEWRIYEFSRALCRINLDPGFKDGKPSDDQHRQTILEDLSAASKDNRVAGLLKTEPDIKRWRKLNKVGWPVQQVEKTS